MPPTSSPSRAALGVVIATATFVSGALATPLEAQTDASAFRVPTTNPPALVSQWIASTKVEISYHRPRVRGRPIFGSLVPYGRVWRTGSDAATRISFSTPVSLDGVEVPAGTYELFTIPGESEWTVIVHADRSQWGSYSYDAADDVARIAARPQRLDTPVESFTISVDDVRNASATLNISWDRTRVPVEVEVDVRATVIPGLEEALRSGARPPHFLAAMFYYENDLDLDRAAELMELALETAPGHIGMLHRQALILAAKGDTALAVAAARRSLEGAASAGRELRDEYTRLNEALLDRLRRGR